MGMRVCAALHHGQKNIYFFQIVKLKLKSSPSCQMKVSTKFSYYTLGECRTLWGECEQAACILATEERMIC